MPTKIIENEKSIIDYDDEYDSFAVSHKKKGKYKCSVDMEDFIFDIDSKGNIIGVEILNASENLKAFKITKEILKNMVNADFNVSRKNNFLYIYLHFFLSNKEDRK